MNPDEFVAALYGSIAESCVMQPGSAHIEIHGNEVLSTHPAAGLEIEAESFSDCTLAMITVRRHCRIEKPVRLCFGVLGETGRQHVDLKIRLEEAAHAAFLANCIFPHAVDVSHSLVLRMEIGRGAECIYRQRHFHGGGAGAEAIPRARIRLDEDATLHTDLELVSGGVGRIDLEYEAECLDRSALEMAARISGRADDEIKISQKAHLKGQAANGLLKTNIAVRERAAADVKHTLIASAPGARGHVDCRQIVRNQAIAAAVPIVEVNHPQALVTHKACVGGIDEEKLATLMSRGLTEDQAADLIIEGLLTPDGSGTAPWK